MPKRSPALAMLVAAWARVARRRHRVAALMVVLVLALVGVSVAKVAAPASTGGDAAAASVRYRTLKQLGVTARGASLTGRTVRVRLTNRRGGVEVRLAAIRNRARNLQAWSAVTLKRGSRTLVRRLNKTPTGEKLNLRVTARIGRIRARGIIALPVLAPANPPAKPAPTQPAPTPPAQPTPPAGPTNRAPTSLSVSSAAVAENQPAGTAVGTLSAADPDAGDTPAFSLVAGAGSADNASFAIDGTTLRTTAPFDYETKASYAIRVRASDGHGGTFDRELTVTVTDVDDAPVLTTSAGTTANTENNTATVDGGITVSDADDANLQGATARVSAGFQTGDELVFAGAAGITGNYVAATGVLTLTGSASVATYQAALRSVGYRHTGDDPSAAKTIAFAVTDDTSTSAVATKAIAVTPVNDAPVATTSGGSATFTEGAGPAGVDGGLTLSDPDSAQLSGARVSIGANLAAAQDGLAFTAQSGITGSYDVPTGVLTLTGAATVAQYRAVLRSVTYANSSDNPSAGARTISFRVTDAASANSNLATRNVTITATNDAPVATTTGGKTTYTENAAGVLVDAGVTASDADDTNLESAQARIMPQGFDAGDTLAFTAQPGITGSYDGNTGVLSLTGTATLADYQTALRSVAFGSTVDSPKPDKTVEFKLNDGDTDSVIATKDITVTPVDDAPTVTTTSAALAYSEGAGPLAADAGLTVSDPDSTQLSGATVRISASFDAAQDELAFAPQLGITGSYDDATGELELTGTAPVADYQAALRAVTYANVADDPTPPTRILAFTATDAEAQTSASATRGVTLGAQNDSATIATTPSALAYTEGDPATAVDGGLTVADPDDTALTGATVTISAGLQADDELLFTSQLGITGSYDGASGALSLTGTATLAEYQTALRSVRYRHIGDAPGPVKTIELRADDGDGLGPAAVRNVTVTPAADAPVVDTSVGNAAYTEDTAPTPIDPGVTVTDPDPSPTIAGATVKITGSYAGAQDVLALASPATHPGITPAVAGDTLTLAGDATPAEYQSALRDVTYVNTSQAPSATTRTVTFAATDSTTLSGSDTRQIAVTPSDDVPIAANDSATVLEDSGATSVPVLANDDDVDGGPKTIASVVQPSNGTVTITGGGTGLTYEPDANYCNNPPGGGQDTFTYTLTPGGATATVAMTVTCAADPPDIITSGGSLAYTENDPASPIDTGVTVTDPDAGAFITGATVAITSNFAAGQDVLELSGLHAPITAGPQIGNTLTLTGTGTPAAYQAALRDVTYRNTSEGPSSLARTATFTVTDDTALSDSATRGITVAGVNDPPTAVDDSGTTDEDTTLNVAAPGVLANDTDADPGDTKTVVALNGSGTLTQTLPSGASVTINANGSYAYNPLSAFQGLSTGQTASDSFTYTMADGSGAQDTATVNLTVNGISDAPAAVADSYDAIGNTGLFVGTTRPASQAGEEITGSVLANDTDPDTPSASLVAEPVTNAPTTLGGTITVESDGNFTYHPDDGDTGVTDTFTYRVCDATPCNSGTVANATGTLSLPIAGQVWYVRNSQAAGGDGTSDTPFDTTAEAEAASGTGDTTFVFDGTNTTTNLDTGYAMNAGERLIGESRPLSLDPDGGGPLGTASLFTGTSGAQPTLTASNEDAIVLASNVLVDGIDVDPSGTGGGISGTAGTSDVTVQNANVTDTGTKGTQPGIELDGTTGVNRFTGVTVTNGGSATAIGVRINNADRVLFSDTATNTISTTGAKALDAASTSLLTSRWDDITVTGSGTGAIRMNATTGQPVLGDGAGTDLSLQTTSGSTAALDIASSNTVSVDSGGTDTISATGGPAADIRNSNGSQYQLDSVSSTNSAGDGINLDTNLGAPFVANAGAISGATGIAVDVNGGGAGGGGVIYAGAINDGSGQSAEVTGRDGGGVTLSGNIADSADAGGGIVVSGNTAGTTTFSGASKVLNTGASNAVALSANGNPAGGHLVSFTGGGLDIDTTSGTGLSASNGTLTVGGTGNSITTGTGTGLNVDTAGITAGNLNFDSISSNGATNGIRLNTTGTAGGLNVTGTGGACATTADACTGGTIQSTTQDAVSLSSAQAISLQRMKVRNGLGNGVRGNNVTNVALRDSVVDNNGDDAATDEAGLHFTNLLGTSEVTRTLVANSPEDNARIVNSSGTLSQLNVTDSTFRDTDTVSPGNNGLLLQADGGSITADVLGNTFLRNRANGLQVITNGTGSMNVEVDDSATAQSTFDDNNIGVSIAHNSSGTFSYGVRDLTIDGLNVAPGTGGSASPINVNLASAATTPMVGRVTGNTVTNSNSTTGPGLRFTGNGSATMTTLIDANTVSQVANRGIEIIARDGSNRINATVSNNSVTLNNALSADAIRVDAGSVSTDTTTVCADIRGNTASTTAIGLFGIRTRQRFAGTTFILEDYAGAPTDDAAVQSFLSGNNNAATASADHAGAGFTSIADCPTPP